MPNLNKYIFNFDFELFLNFNNCTFEQDKILNQKYFYTDKKEFINKEYLYFHTKANAHLKLQEEKRIEFDKYLKNNNIADKYFRNFGGYLMLVKFEGYNKFTNEFKKGAFIYFINVLWKEKLIIMLQSELDIKIVLLLISEYLYHFRANNIPNLFNKEEFVKYFNNKFDYQNFDFFYEIELIEIYKNIQVYLTNLGKIYYNFKGLFYNTEINKKYIFLQNQQKDNIEKIRNIKYNEIVFFQNFNGIVFLLEATFIINENNKIKRYVLLFYNFNSKDYLIIEIINKKNSIKAMDIIQGFLILNTNTKIINQELLYGDEIDIEKISLNEINKDAFDLNRLNQEVLDKEKISDFFFLSMYNKTLNLIDFDCNYTLTFNYKHLLFSENNEIKSIDFNKVHLEKESLKLLQIENKDELMFYLLYNHMVNII